MVHTPVTKFVAKNCDNLLVVTTSLLFLLLSASRLFLLLFSFLVSFLVGFQFQPFRLLQQCVKKNNTLEPWKKTICTKYSTVEGNASSDIQPT